MMLREPKCETIWGFSWDEEAHFGSPHAPRLCEVSKWGWHAFSYGETPALTSDDIIGELLCSSPGWEQVTKEWRLIIGWADMLVSAGDLHNSGFKPTLFTAHSEEFISVGDGALLTPSGEKKEIQVWDDSHVYCFNSRTMLQGWKKYSCSLLL